jgi:antirestriction protein
MSNPQVYVACLAAYNNGHLHGVWIDAAQDIDDLREAIQRVLDTSPIPDAEEWAIHDYNDMPNLGEYPSLERVVQAAELVERYSLEAVEAYISHKGEDADLDDFECNYRGEFKSEEDFAIQHVEDIGLLKGVPEAVSMYFDYEAYARDIFINDFFEENGHVFECN